MRTAHSVVTEALYASHYCLYLMECDSVEDAELVLTGGEDIGVAAGLGIFVDGELVQSWRSDVRARSSEELAALYARVKKHVGPGSPTVPRRYARW